MNRLVTALAITLALAGCATHPLLPAAAEHNTQPAASALSRGATVAAVAESQIGAPYRFGGASPSGFDCSGLVFFAHAHINIFVPRTVAGLRRAARPVARRALAPGDLLFFGAVDGEPGHVGIYAGGDRFVHAPRSGQVVSYGYLSDPYYARRFLSAGTLLALNPTGHASNTAP
ncbi:MAG TPA: C40 family peptidase [Steroidobacteraceae bacterium]